MDIQIGDILIMKKPHPCGECRFTVGRVGMDFRIRCNGCGREVMVARAKVEKISGVSCAAVRNLTAASLQSAVCRNRAAGQAVKACVLPAEDFL